MTLKTRSPLPEGGATSRCDVVKLTAMPGAWEISEGIDYFIAIASTGKASVSWAITLKEFQIPGSYNIGLWLGLPVDIARNRLVRDAQERNARYIFFLDDDILPPADTLRVLTESQLPIVSGLYWAKRGTPAMWLQDKEGKYGPILEWAPGQLVRIDAAGAGCLLIDMKVFDQIGNPWFKWEVEDPKKPVGLSEDWYFFKRAAESGFHAFCDTRVRCIHEARSELFPEGTYRPTA